MFLFIHVLVGASIGVFLSDWPLAITAAFLSHFVLDVIPHFDPGSLHEKGEECQTLSRIDWFLVIADIFIALMLWYFIIWPRDFSFMVTASAIAASLIDILDNGTFFFGRYRPIILSWPVFKQIHWVHDKIHYTARGKQIIWASLIELAIAGGCIWYLLGS